MKEGGCDRTEELAEKIRTGWYTVDPAEEAHIRRTDRAIAAIREEVARQDSKWGANRSMPSFTEQYWGELMPCASEAKALVEEATEYGELAWEDILFEELCEAHAEKDDVEALCTELIQSAAVIVQWVSALRAHGIERITS